MKVVQHLGLSAVLYVWLVLNKNFEQPKIHIRWHCFDSAYILHYITYVHIFTIGSSRDNSLTDYLARFQVTDWFNCNITRSTRNSDSSSRLRVFNLRPSKTISSISRGIFSYFHLVLIYFLKLANKCLWDCANYLQRQLYDPR